MPSSNEPNSAEWGDSLVLAGRLVGVLHRVAVAKRPCKLCGVDLYALPVRDKEKPVWYSKYGEPHELDCPKLKSERSVTRPKGQDQLFDSRPHPD